MANERERELFQTVFINTSRLMAGAYRLARSASQASPTGFAMAVGFTKMSSGDLCAQAIEGRVEVDWKRTWAFAAFGLVVNGMVQHNVFTRLMPRLFPSAHAFGGEPVQAKLRNPIGLLHCVWMTIVYEVTFTPFMIFPAFYLAKEYIQGDGDACRALRAARNNAMEDNIQSMCIFMPCNLVNFSIVPPQLRAPIATLAGAVWAVLLSLARGAGTPQRPSHQAAASLC